MKKRVIVVSDTCNLAPINAMVNAVRYYGIEAELHIIHWCIDPPYREYEEQLRKDKAFDFVKFIDGQKLTNEIRELFEHREPHVVAMSPKVCMNRYRYMYPELYLQEYDSAVILDHDILIANDFSQYFTLVEGTGMIAMPNNEATKGSIKDFARNGYTVGNINQGSCPLHNMPIFFRPKDTVKLFRDMMFLNEEYGLKGGTMPNLNRSIIKNDMVDRIFETPGNMFLNCMRGSVKLNLCEASSKLYLVRDGWGDRIYSIHGKFWYTSICESKIKKYSGPLADNYKHTILNIWKMYYFQNTKLNNKIEWDTYKWGTQPWKEVSDGT